jgi:hypothetical protein
MSRRHPHIRRTIRLLMVVALLLVATAATASAKKDGKGKLTATIGLAQAESSSGDIYFDVTRSKWDHKETIWVTTTCWDADGELTFDRDRAVQWGLWNSLDGLAGPFTPSGDWCEAYVTIRPWQDRALGDAILGFFI